MQRRIVDPAERNQMHIKYWRENRATCSEKQNPKSHRHIVINHDFHDNNMMPLLHSSCKKYLRVRNTVVPGWKRWLLWVVLIAGVVVVGIMSLKLYREMNDKREGM